MDALSNIFLLSSCFLLITLTSWKSERLHFCADRRYGVPGTGYRHFYVSTAVLTLSTLARESSYTVEREREMHDATLGTWHRLIKAQNFKNETST